MPNNNGSDKSDIWCCSCGDQDYYAELEKRVIHWRLKDSTRGIGICEECAKILSEENLVLPKEDR